MSPVSGQISARPPQACCSLLFPVLSRHLKECPSRRDRLIRWETMDGKRPEPWPRIGQWTVVCAGSSSTDLVLVVSVFCHRETDLERMVLELRAVNDTDFL